MSKKRKRKKTLKELWYTFIEEFKYFWIAIGLSAIIIVGTLIISFIIIEYI